MNCPKCGKEMPETAALCTFCGWKSKKWEETKQQGKDEHNTLVFAIVSIAVLCILGIVAIALII